MQLRQTSENNLRILKHPIRIQILEFLDIEKSANYNLIKKQCDISSSTLYYHIKFLGNLVKKNEQNFYELSTEGDDALNYFFSLMGKNRKTVELENIIKKNKLFIYLNIIKHPLRRQILLMFENREKIRYKDFLIELKISNGILFYHLRYLKDLIKVTQNKEYTPTAEGKYLISIAKGEHDSSLDIDKENHQDISILTLNKWSLEGNYKKIIAKTFPSIKDVSRTYLHIEALIETGELDQAEILLDQMLNNLENERNIVYGLYYSCICLVKRGEYSKAEEYLKNCIDIFETNKWEQKDPINDLKICFQIKKMEIVTNQNKLEEAIRYSEQILEEINEQSNNKIRGDFYVNSGEIYFKKGEFQTALNHYEKGYEYYKITKNMEDLGKALTRLSKAYYRKANTRKALEVNLEALEKLKINNNPLSIAITLYLRGMLFRQLTEYKKAFDCFEQTITVSKKYGNPNFIVNNYICLGDICHIIFDLKDAKYYFQQALDYAHFLENRDSLGVLYMHIGYLRKREEKLEEAVDYYFKAEKIFLETTRPSHLLESLRLRGELYHCQGRLEKAKELFEKILTLNVKFEIKRQYILSWSALSQIYMDQGLIDESLSYLEKADGLARKMDDQVSLTIIDARMSLLFYQIGKFEQASEKINILIEKSISNNNQESLADALVNLGKIYLKMGKKEIIHIINKFPKKPFKTNEIRGYFRILNGILAFSSENWSEAYSSFEIVLNMIGLNYCDKIYCNEKMVQTSFNKWKGNSSEENYEFLKEKLETWKNKCIINQLHQSLIKSNIIEAKIHLINLEFDIAKEILKNTLKRAQNLNLSVEITEIKIENENINQKIDQIKKMNL